MVKTKRARRPEARPDEILDAALQVFTETGFAAARVEDVAKAAGLSKGAVYLYFDSKEALFEALVRRFAEQVVAVGAARFPAMAQEDPEGALRGAIRFLVGVVSDPSTSAAPRLVLAEAQRFPAIAALYRCEVLAVARRVFGALRAAGVARGQFRDVPLEIALKSTMGPILAHMFITHLFPDPDAPPPDPIATADAFADILLNGLRPRAAQTDESAS
jgi:AcrR family transcriptional regulator